MHFAYAFSNALLPANVIIKLELDDKRDIWGKIIKTNKAAGNIQGAFSIWDAFWRYSAKLQTDNEKWLFCRRGHLANDSSCHYAIHFWKYIYIFFQGDRFGGALDGAARMFSHGLDSGMAPMEFVNDMRKKGQLIMGIGHRVKSVRNLWH